MILSTSLAAGDGPQVLPGFWSTRGGGAGGDGVGSATGISSHPVLVLLFPDLPLGCLSEGP